MLKGFNQAVKVRFWVFCDDQRQYVATFGAGNCTA